MLARITLKSRKTLLQNNKRGLHPWLAIPCSMIGPDMVQKLSSGLFFLYVQLSFEFSLFPSQLSVLDAHRILYDHISSISLLWKG